VPLSFFCYVCVSSAQEVAGGLSILGLIAWLFAAAGCVLAAHEVGWLRGRFTRPHCGAVLCNRVWGVPTSAAQLSCCHTSHSSHAGTGAVVPQRLSAVSGQRLRIYVHGQQYILFSLTRPQGFAVMLLRRKLQ
jgi:hypothetical protein